MRLKLLRMPVFEGGAWISEGRRRGRGVPIGVVKRRIAKLRMPMLYATRIRMRGSEGCVGEGGCVALSMLTKRPRRRRHGLHGQRDEEHKDNETQAHRHGCRI
jgi:hypothetical protein